MNYAIQQDGIELISVLNELADGVVWREVTDAESEVTFTDSSGISLQVTESQVRSNQGKRQLVWHWFEVGRYSTNKAVYAKIYQMLSVIDSRQDGNLFALTMECSDNCDNARRFAGAVFLPDLSRNQIRYCRYRLVGSFPCIDIQSRQNQTRK